MGRIADHQKVDRSRLQAADNAVQRPIPHPVAPPGPLAPSPFMQCSLPNLAASYDQYVRQFYGRSSLPTARLLPTGIQK